MQDLLALTSSYWQPKVGVLGDVVTELEDIHQCILTILSTPRGSDPHRPDFAVNLLDWVDKPINSVRAVMVQEVLRAIARWEARAVVKRVTVDIGMDGASLTMTVYWVPSSLENDGGQLLASSFTVPTPVTLVTSPFVAIPFSSTLTLAEVDGGVL